MESQRAQTELEGAGGWIELRPTRRSRWQTRRSSECRELPVLQSRKAVIKCSIKIMSVWRLSTRLLSCLQGRGSPRAGNEGGRGRNSFRKEL